MSADGPYDKRLRLMEGASKPRTYHRRGDEQQWVCSRCEETTGAATSSLERFEDILSPVFRDGKLVGGMKRRGLRCAVCKTVVTVTEKLI